MSDAWKSRSYSFSLCLAAMITRALVGIARPQLSLAATAVIGVTTVVLLAPLLHRRIYDRQLLVSRRQQAGYALLTSAALLGFGAWVLAA